MRNQPTGNPFSYEAILGTGRINLQRRIISVALVQGIVSTGDKDLSPLDEASGEETSYRAKNDFLGKGGVHFASLWSR